MSIQKRNRKKEAFFHCKDRAKERYGLILTKAIYENMVRQIKENRKQTLIKKLSNIRSVHKVAYDSEDFYVIYHKNLDGLVTFLPKDMTMNDIREETRMMECFNFVI